MPVTTAIRQGLEESFGLYRDLVETVDSDVLASKLPGLPSNSMGLQLWCVIGARESYSRAILADAWAGFSCSLDQPDRPDRVAAALRRSEAEARGALESIDTYSDTQSQLIVGLLGHESAHHGQLIRYLYALRLPIPGSWKAKYALD